MRSEKQEKMREKMREIKESFASDADTMDFIAEAISQSLEIEVFSYNDKITDDFLKVMKAVDEGRVICTDGIADKLSLNRDYVELIQYLLCNNDHAEYGTSPRCCWLTEKGENLLMLLREFEHEKRKAEAKSAGVG